MIAVLSGQVERGQAAKAEGKDDDTNNGELMDFQEIVGDLVTTNPNACVQPQNRTYGEPLHCWGAALQDAMFLQGNAEATPSVRENFDSIDLQQFGTGMKNNWLMRAYGLALDINSAQDELRFWTLENHMYDPHGAPAPWTTVYVRAKGKPKTERWATTLQMCPPTRACDTTLAHISCLGDKQVLTVPEIENRVADSVDLSSNAIGEVLGPDFAGMANLTKLVLKDNLITRISVGAFVGCASLNFLDVSTNMLKFAGIPEKLFNKLYALETVTLVENLLTSLPEYLFKDTRQLKSIQVVKNDFRFYPPNLIRSLPKLKSFEVYFQFLVIADTSPTNVQVVPPGFYADLPSLELFFMGQAGSNLVVSPDLFAGNPNIKQIYLSQGLKECHFATLFKGLRNCEFLQFHTHHCRRDLIPNMFSDLESLEYMLFTGNEVTGVQVCHVTFGLL